MSMKKLTFILLSLLPLSLLAQNYNQLTDNGEFIQGSDAWGNRKDTLKAEHREIPRGLKVWTVDERLGERVAAQPDTLQHMFMNTIFTTGMRGEYSSTGNLGAPRYNRIFIDNASPQQFMFTQPYDFFITPVD